jgi:hypothetical protein
MSVLLASQERLLHGVSWLYEMKNLKAYEVEL